MLSYFKNVLDRLMSQPSASEASRMAYFTQKQTAAPAFTYPISIHRETFYQNLRKTINYTQRIVDKIGDHKRIDYATVLRSVNPLYNDQLFYTYSPGEPFSIAPPDIPFDYDLVLTLAMRERVHFSLPSIPMEQAGKILRFEIDLTTYDRAAVSESLLVDNADIPAIDTWFYVTQQYLYCWIPTLFIPIIQPTIDTGVSGSYHWLEDVASEQNQQFINRLNSENHTLPETPLMQRYAAVTTSWGVVVFLEMQAIVNPSLQPTDTRIDAGIYLRILDTYHFSNKMLVHWIGHALLQHAAFLRRQAMGAETLFIVTKVDIDRTDFQDEGLYCATLQWLSYYYNTDLPVVPVYYDKATNKYMFDLPPMTSSFIAHRLRDA